jgi:peptide deformylase
MSVRDILQIGHPVLATRANEVPLDQIQSTDIQTCIDDMIDTMRDVNGAGIAANQIGRPYRIFVIEVGNNPRYPYKPKIPLTVAINPNIDFLSDKTFVSNEGCLSVPQIRANVNRHIEIAVSYYDRAGERVSLNVSGYSACTWQHENDHLDGILFPHRVTDPNSFCSWSTFQEFYQKSYSETVAELVHVWGE